MRVAAEGKEPRCCALIVCCSISSASDFLPVAVGGLISTIRQLLHMLVRCIMLARCILAHRCRPGVYQLRFLHFVEDWDPLETCAHMLRQNDVNRCAASCWLQRLAKLGWLKSQLCCCILGTIKQAMLF